MNTETSESPARRPSLLRNWISLIGLVVVVGSLFSTLLLFILDSISRGSNPYLGILTYCVAPVFFLAGLFLTIVGVLRERRRHDRAEGGIAPRLVVDLSRPRDRRMMAGFIVGTILFLLLSAVGSYHTYHFSESVTFCGQACHGVMQPEMVTYQHGPHARVACVECHIGSGAKWFVKAKVSGSYQLYSVAFDKYPRPIPTPVHNLRPARDTCEKCHWPEKFVGDMVKNYDYFLSDATNSHQTLQMMLKVGGPGGAHGSAAGVHWHVNPSNRVEYVATDDKRLKIPWVRMTGPDGKMTEFRTKAFTNDISGYEIRTMDCMDCHNRPAHRYKSSSDALNIVMAQGKVDPALPWIKTNAAFALERAYTNETQALAGISSVLSERYPGDARIQPAIAAVQEIYKTYFFPEMKASWKDYPEHIGHKNWPGCSRCHDDQHVANDGSKRKIVFSDCTTCHVIQGQSNGGAMEKLSAKGQPFAHPTDEIPDGFMCIDCHGERQ